MEDIARKEEAEARRSRSQRTLAQFFGAWGIVVLIFCSYIFYESVLLQTQLKRNGQQLLLSPTPRAIPARRLDESICERQCREVEIPFPFGLSEECAISSSFVLECRTNVLRVDQSAGFTQVGAFPFLNNVATGYANGTVPGILPYNYTANSFQVRNITPGSIVIDTTGIKAPSCSLQGDELGEAYIRLDPLGPYRISDANIFVAVGCTTTVNFTYELDGNGGGGTATCSLTACSGQRFYDFCNFYDCCTLSIQPALNILLQGIGNCGSGSLLLPSSYVSEDPEIMLNATYGMELAWAIPSLVVGLCGNESLLQSPDYACSEANVVCNNVSLETLTFQGYYCTCKAGFSGNGIKKGMDCTDSQDKKANVSLIVGSTLGGAFILLLSSMAMVVIWRLWRQLSIASKLLEEVQQELTNRKVQPPFFSYHDLKGATRGFHEDTKLGSGAFGAVYQGILPDGRVVAVKRLFNSDKAQVLNEFLSEVALISGIKHKHLIQLMGCCIKDEERILVYELARNGNLAEALWGEQKIAVDLRKRLNIAVGVARGLSYLHEELQPRIIHRDIKAVNILLDDN